MGKTIYLVVRLDFETQNERFICGPYDSKNVAEAWCTIHKQGDYNGDCYVQEYRLVS